MNEEVIKALKNSEDKDGVKRRGACLPEIQPKRQSNDRKLCTSAAFRHFKYKFPVKTLKENKLVTELEGASYLCNWCV